MLAFGNKWSEAWLATGFTHRGTNVPKRTAPRIELAGRLAKFFADNQKYEVPFAGVTAKTARALCAKITAAQDELRAEETAVKAQKRQRDAAEKSLRREMHWVVVVLRRLIKKNDLRWLDFGLKQPKPDAAPSQPVQVAAPAPVAVEFGGEKSAAGPGQAAA